jgi:hypothetical protein
VILDFGERQGLRRPFVSRSAGQFPLMVFRSPAQLLWFLLAAWFLPRVKSSVLDLGQRASPSFRLLIFGLLKISFCEMVCHPRSTFPALDSRDCVGLRLGSFQWPPAHAPAPFQLEISFRFHVLPSLGY